MPKLAIRRGLRKRRFASTNIPSGSGSFRYRILSSFELSVKLGARELVRFVAFFKANAFESLALTADRSLMERRARLRGRSFGFPAKRNDVTKRCFHENLQLSSHTRNVCDTTRLARRSGIKCTHASHIATPTNLLFDL
jgi:hypothetical protein